MAASSRRTAGAAVTAGDIFLGGSASSAFDQETRVMTYALVNKICRDTGGYSLPRINSNLYLQGNNFRKIECLDKYVNLRALHLESNLFSRIEGLGHMSKLRILYLDRNLLKVVEGLEGCTELSTLNISANQLHRIDGLPPSLATFNASGNHLCRLEHVEPLKHCPLLSVVDLSNNGIGEEFVNFFQDMPSLRVLYLMGNPVTKVANYRRTLVSKLTGLTYLDTAPVEAIERRAVDAWLTGGDEAFFAARVQYHTEQREKERRQRLNFAAERAERALLRAQTQDHPGFSPQQWEAYQRFEPLAGAARSHPTASPEELAQLPARALEEEDVLYSGAFCGSECVVCQESYRPGDRVLALPCVHHFHGACITPWLSKFSSECPICRTALHLPARPSTAPSSAPSPTSPTPHPRARPGAALDASANTTGTAERPESASSTRLEGLSAGCVVRDRHVLTERMRNCRLSGNLLFGNIWDAPAPSSRGGQAGAAAPPPPREGGDGGAGARAAASLEVDPALGLAPTRISDGVAESNAAQVKELLARAYKRHNIHGRRAAVVGGFVGTAREGAPTSRPVLQTGLSREGMFCAREDKAVLQWAAKCDMQWVVDAVLEELIAHTDRWALRMADHGADDAHGSDEDEGEGEEATPVGVLMARELWAAEHHHHQQTEAEDSIAWGDGAERAAAVDPPESAGDKRSSAPPEAARSGPPPPTVGSSRDAAERPTADAAALAAASEGRGCAAAEFEGEGDHAATAATGGDADDEESAASVSVAPLPAALNLKVTHGAALHEEDEDAWMWESIQVDSMPYI